MRTILSLVLLAIIVAAHGAVLFVPRRAAAADLMVTPAVLDRSVFARDILNEAITITNLTGRKTTFYPVVQNIATVEGRQQFLPPSAADLSSSLANWISLSRSGIELAPNEERRIDLKINVNLNAKPGIYHAAIAFPPGSTRAEAEAALDGAPTVLVNLTVQDDAKEILGITKFAPVSTIFFTAPASFTYTLDNTGNRVVTPTGEIIIYDHTGREIGSVPVNPAGTTVNPDSQYRFYSTWKNEGHGFGRYKAYLSLEYGAADERMQDTVYFWIVPWYAALLIIGALGGIMFVVASMIHARYARWHRAHVARIAQEHRTALRNALIEQHTVLAGAPASLTVPVPPPAYRSAFAPVARNIPVSPAPSPAPVPAFVEADLAPIPPPPPMPPVTLAAAPRASFREIPVPAAAPLVPMPMPVPPPPIRFANAPIFSVPPPSRRLSIPSVPRIRDLVPDPDQHPARPRAHPSARPMPVPVARIVSDLRPHDHLIREA